MALSIGLLVKGVFVTCALASTVATGYFYGDEIKSAIKRIGKSIARKTDGEINGKIKNDLNINVEECSFKNNESSKTCNLNKDQLKVINFFNKSGDSDLTISNLDNNKTIKLTIERDHDQDTFHFGLRFTFTNENTDNDVEIGTDSNKITLKKNSTPKDFKIKTTDNKLEDAWDLTTLEKKLKITCPQDSTNECSLPQEGLNVWRSEEDYILKAKVGENKKITVDKSSEKHRQGFKFTVKEDMELTEGSKKKESSELTKLFKDNKTYEVDIKSLGDGTKKWFLIEKSTT